MPTGVIASCAFKSIIQGLKVAGLFSLVEIATGVIGSWLGIALTLSHLSNTYIVGARKKC